MTVRIYTIVLLLFASASVVIAQTESWTLMNRGDRLFKKGDFEAAEKCYDDALQLDSTNLRARYNLADSYLAQQDANNAYNNFMRVTEEGKDTDKSLTSKAFHNMGVIVQSLANAAQNENDKQKNLKQAIVNYQQALRLDPNADNSRYNMVLCMKQLKESEQQQQDQSESEQKEKQEPKKEPKPQPKKEQEQNSNDQTRQILNYARQKEQDTKNKVNVLPAKRHNGKNW